MAGDGYEPVRVAFVGVGNWSRVLANAMSKSGKIVCSACYSRTPASRQAFADAWQCRPADSYADILNDPNIEGVIVATRDITHASLVAEAAEAGKHVFCEKPITNNIADGRRMWKGCEEAGVILSIAHVQRRMGAMRKIKEWVESEGLGQLIQAEASFGTSTGLGLTPDNWRFYESEFPGGCMMGLGVHQVDNLQYLMGPIKCVSAICKRVAISAEVSDVGGAMLEFSSGAVGYLGSNFAAPPHWRLSLLGTKGNMHLALKMSRRNREEYLSFLESSDQGAELIRHMVDGEAKPEPFEKMNNVLVELEEFADCVRLNSKPEVGAKEGLDALAVILAIMRSSSERRIVEVKEIFDTSSG